VKTLVRKKLHLIPQKSHNNARDYIQYKKYIHSIGHWNHQSIVPINSWNSNHVSANKKMWERIRKIANSFKLILTQNVKKVWERCSHAFPPHYTPEPCTLACRRSTFYQHSQFLKRLLQFWYNEKRKHEKNKKRNLSINCHKSCSSDTCYIA